MSHSRPRRGKPQIYASLHANLTKVGRFFALLVFLLTLVGGPTINVKAAETTFAGEELLARPTDTSITVNIVPDETIEYYYEYGTVSGVYSAQTATATTTGA